MKHITRGKRIDRRDPPSLLMPSRFTREPERAVLAIRHRHKATAVFGCPVERLFELVDAARRSQSFSGKDGMRAELEQRVAQLSRLVNVEHHGNIARACRRADRKDESGEVIVREQRINVLEKAIWLPGARRREAL